MYKHLLIIFIVISVISCKSKDSKDQSVSSEPIVMEMTIDGMTCNGCVGTVEASVKQMGEGINSVIVSLDSASAIVEYVPSKIDPEDIKNAIELNGYKVLKMAQKSDLD